MRMLDKKLQKEVKAQVDRLNEPLVKLRLAAGIGKNTNGYWYNDVEHWIREIKETCKDLKHFIKKRKKDLVG